MLGGARASWAGPEDNRGPGPLILGPGFSAPFFPKTPSPFSDLLQRTQENAPVAGFPGGEWTDPRTPVLLHIHMLLFKPREEKADTTNKPRGNKPGGKCSLHQFQREDQKPQENIQRKPGWLAWGDSVQGPPHRERALEALQKGIRPFIVKLASGNLSSQPG